MSPEQQREALLRERIVKLKAQGLSNNLIQERLNISKDKFYNTMTKMNKAKREEYAKARKDHTEGKRIEQNNTTKGE